MSVNYKNKTGKKAAIILQVIYIRDQITLIQVTHTDTHTHILWMER